MKTWKCLIVDDEDVDRLMVVSFVKRFPGLEIVAACHSAAQALPLLLNNEIDILFLDVDMPGSDGLELRRKASHVPVCIFITGHAEHAVETYELDTLDFIVKPLRFERFEKAIERAFTYLSLHEKAGLFDLNTGNDTIKIKEGHELVRVNLSDIICLEALKDYTLLVTSRKKYCIWSNLGALLRQPPFDTFVRVHKSFAIKRQFVTRVTAREIELNGAHIVPVGRIYKDNVKTLL